MRSLTRCTVTVGTARSASTSCVAWSPLTAEQLMSTVTRSARDSLTSMAVTRPPAAPTAVASSPTTDADGGA